jgi:transcriptional regulator with XRE-family HTH domain
MPSAREPEAIYAVFGRHLKELREKRKMAQEELATLSGLTRSSIANVENGKQRVLLHQVVQFAEALNVKFDDLIPTLRTAEPATEEKKSAYLEELQRRIQIGLGPDLDATKEKF